MLCFMIKLWAWADQSRGSQRHQDFFGSGIRHTPNELNVSLLSPVKFFMKKKKQPLSWGLPNCDRLLSVNAVKLQNTLWICEGASP